MRWRKQRQLASVGVRHDPNRQPQSNERIADAVRHHVRQRLSDGLDGRAVRNDSATDDQAADLQATDFQATDLEGADYAAGDVSAATATTAPPAPGDPERDYWHRG